MIELNLDVDKLIGLDAVNASYALYLGAVPIESGNLTGAIREFNLPTAVAPGEWPAPWERVMQVDDEPRCSAGTHGPRNSRCTCEDSRDE